MPPRMKYASCQNPRAPGVAHELLPPLAVRLGAGPALEALEVAPVLTRAGVRRKQRPGEILVEQQPVRLGLPRLLDLRAQAEEPQHAAGAPDAHAEVDDDKVGIGAQVHALAVWSHAAIFAEAGQPDQRPGICSRRGRPARSLRGGARRPR